MLYCNFIISSIFLKSPNRESMDFWTKRTGITLSCCYPIEYRHYLLINSYVTSCKIFLRCFWRSRQTLLENWFQEKNIKRLPINCENRHDFKLIFSKPKSIQLIFFSSQLLPSRPLFCIKDYPNGIFPTLLLLLKNCNSSRLFLPHSPMICK